MHQKKTSKCWHRWRPASNHYFGSSWLVARWNVAKWQFPFEVASIPTHFFHLQTPKFNGNVPLHSTLLFFPKQQPHKAPTACKKRAKALGLLCFQNTCYFLHLGPVRRRKAKRTTATSIAEFHHCTAKSVAAKISGSTAGLWGQFACPFAFSSPIGIPLHVDSWSMHGHDHFAAKLVERGQTTFSKTRGVVDFALPKWWKFVDLTGSKTVRHVAKDATRKTCQTRRYRIDRTASSQAAWVLGWWKFPPSHKGPGVVARVCVVSHVQYISVIGCLYKTHVFLCFGGWSGWHVAENMYHFGNQTCFMLDEHDKSIMKDQPGRMFQVFLVRLNHKHYLNYPSGLVKLMAPFWDLHPCQCFILYILYIYIYIYIHKYVDCTFWNQMLVHWCWTLARRAPSIFAT